MKFELVAAFFVLLRPATSLDEWTEFGQKVKTLRGTRRRNLNSNTLKPNEGDPTLDDRIISEEDSIYWDRVLDDMGFSVSLPPSSSRITPPSLSPVAAGKIFPTTAPQTLLSANGASTQPMLPLTYQSASQLTSPPSATNGSTPPSTEAYTPQTTSSPKESEAMGSTLVPTSSLLNGATTATVAPSTAATDVSKIILSVALKAGEEFDDPNSYQSKALAWLEANQNIGQYTDEQIKQRYSLASIYFATFAVANDITDQDTSPVPKWNDATNWITDEDECNWFGISCDSSGVVRTIELVDNMMTGAFPPEVTLFKETLTDLYLTNNLFHNKGDEYNSFLGELTNLEILLIGDTFFEYPGIPTEIGRLSNLINFECYGTLYHGPLRGEIWTNMPYLNYLDISFNEFNSDVPTEIGLLSSLQSLSVTGSGVTGQIPSEIGVLPIMQQLHFQGNQLHGMVPSEIGNLKELEVLRVENNLIQGPMPESVCELADKEELQVLTADCMNVTAFECTCCTTCFS